MSLMDKVEDTCLPYFDSDSIGYGNLVIDLLKLMKICPVDESRYYDYLRVKFVNSMLENELAKFEAVL